jgi:hypothetical protein
MHAKLETASTDHWGPDLKPIAVSYVRLSSTKLAGHAQLVISEVLYTVIGVVPFLMLFRSWCCEPTVVVSTVE